MVLMPCAANFIVVVINLSRERSQYEIEFQTRVLEKNEQKLLAC
jgi:hypothetical protein